MYVSSVSAFLWFYIREEDKRCAYVSFESVLLKEREREKERKGKDLVRISLDSCTQGRDFWDELIAAMGFRKFTPFWVKSS